MSKILPIAFNDKSVKPKEGGLFFVLFRLFKSGKVLGFDYGFASYNGDKFEDVVGENGVICEVWQWCKLPNPQLLL